MQPVAGSQLKNILDGVLRHGYGLWEELKADLRLKRAMRRKLKTVTWVLLVRLLAVAAERQVREKKVRQLNQEKRNAEAAAQRKILQEQAAAAQQSAGANFYNSLFGQAPKPQPPLPTPLPPKPAVLRPAVKENDPDGDDEGAEAAAEVKVEVKPVEVLAALPDVMKKYPVATDAVAEFFRALKEQEQQPVVAKDEGVAGMDVDGDAAVKTEPAVPVKSEQDGIKTEAPDVKPPVATSAQGGGKAPAVKAEEGKPAAKVEAGVLQQFIMDFKAPAWMPEVSLIDGMGHASKAASKLQSLESTAALIEVVRLLDLEWDDPQRAVINNILNQQHSLLCLPASWWTVDETTICTKRARQYHLIRGTKGNLATLKLGCSEQSQKQDWPTHTKVFKFLKEFITLCRRALAGEVVVHSIVRTFAPVPAPAPAPVPRPQGPPLASALARGIGPAIGAAYHPQPARPLVHQMFRPMPPMVAPPHRPSPSLPQALPPRTTTTAITTTTPAAVPKVPALVDITNVDKDDDEGESSPDVVVVSSPMKPNMPSPSYVAPAPAPAPPLQPVVPASEARQQGNVTAPQPQQKSSGSTIKHFFKPKAAPAATAQSPGASQPAGP
jgi:hypothetical protein